MVMACRAALGGGGASGGGGARAFGIGVDACPGAGGGAAAAGAGAARGTGRAALLTAVAAPRLALEGAAAALTPPRVAGVRGAGIAADLRRASSALSFAVSSSATLCAIPTGRTPVGVSVHGWFTEVKSSHRPPLKSSPVKSSLYTAVEKNVTSFGELAAAPGTITK